MYRTAETLFVLGNGFDLAHGLPTAYRDFFYFVEAIQLQKTSPSSLNKTPILKQLFSNLVTILGRDIVNEYYQEGKLVFTQIPDK